MQEILLSPELLRQHSIPVVRLVQYPGEWIISSPGAYHSGFNHGYNCAESTNFATSSWLPFGAVARPCPCRKDSVQIQVSKRATICEAVCMRPEVMHEAQRRLQPPHECAESTNFAPSSWLPFGAVARPCPCRKDSVQIQVSKQATICEAVCMRPEVMHEAQRRLQPPHECAESTNFAPSSWLPFGAVARPCPCRKDSVQIQVSKQAHSAVRKSAGGQRSCTALRHGFQSRLQLCGEYLLCDVQLAALWRYGPPLPLPQGQFADLNE